MDIDDARPPNFRPIELIDTVPKVDGSQPIAFSPLRDVYMQTETDDLTPYFAVNLILRLSDRRPEMLKWSMEELEEHLAGYNVAELGALLRDCVRKRDATFERQVTQGTAAVRAIAHEDSGIFEHVDSAPGARYLPYIKVVCGISASPHVLATSPAEPSPKLAKQKRSPVDAHQLRPSGSGTSPSWPTRPKARASNATPTVPLRRSDTTHRHPMYSILVHGCSSRMYRVITKDENGIYRNILQLDNRLGDHPRKDSKSLDAVLKQKPFFCLGKPSNCWVEDEVFNSTPCEDPERYVILRYGDVPSDVDDANVMDMDNSALPMEDA